MSAKTKSAHSVYVNTMKKIKVLVLLVTLIKVLAIFNIQPVIMGYSGGAWLGSDGESFIEGYKELRLEGFFSDSKYLTYWAPGYPFFLFLLSFLSSSNLLITTSLIQTLIFSGAIYFLCITLVKMGQLKTSLVFCILALLNPTLTLTSMQLGYENLVASICAIILGLFLLNLNSNSNVIFDKKLLIAVMLMGLGIWLSPRMILAFTVFTLIWIIAKKSKKFLISGIMALIILVGFQGLMLERNHIATGNYSSQTSIGALALMGAGPFATGTYMTESSGLKCDTEQLSEVAANSKKLKCALNWYTNNPLEGSVLLFKKSLYLWSPWFGPLAGGTNARNPYLEFHPIKNLIKSEKQFNFVYGFWGYLVSWIIILGGWLLLILGFIYLWKMGGALKKFSFVALSLIVSNWLAVLVVHGDNRYRIPLMSVSLLLQVFGYFNLRSKLSILSVRLSRNSN